VGHVEGGGEDLAAAEALPLVLGRDELNLVATL
jgi:hypothetical protein